jgi:MFS transporter, AAHS family, 4-hydroxybenzoate transporter
LSQIIEVERFVDEQRLGWFNVNLLVWSFLAMFADGFDLQVMAFAAPELTRLWHIPSASFGVALAASLVGILFGALLFGYIGDRFGRKLAIVTGCIIYGVATLAVMAAGNLNEIVVLRFVTGIGLGSLMPNTIALNAELSPKRWRATLIVLMFMGITLGGIVPGTVKAWLVPVYGWRILFLIGGVAPLVIAIGVLAALPESIKLLARWPHRRAQLLHTARRMRRELSIPDDAVFRLQHTAASSGLGLRQIFGDSLAPITALLWVAFMAVLMTNFFLTSWLPVIFEQNGLTPLHATIATIWYHVGATLGGVLVSIVLDRVGIIVMVVLFALAAPFVAAIGWPGHSFVSLATLVGVSGFCVVGVLFGTNASAGLLYPTEFRSKGVGWAFAVGRIGSIVGLLVGGILIGMHLPTQRLFLAPAIPMVVGAIAAAGLAAVCYRRFRGFKLDDTPADRGKEAVQ